MKTIYKNNKKPELTNDAWLALIIVQNTAEEYGASYVRITSTRRDRKKGHKLSLHNTRPFSQAFDFTIGLKRPELQLFNVEVKKRLKKADCDYVWHDSGSGFHGHVENDFKV
jgi:hypothetical protein